MPFFGENEKIEKDPESIGSYRTKSLKIEDIAAEIRFNEVEGGHGVSPSREEERFSR